MTSSVSTWRPSVVSSSSASSAQLRAGGMPELDGRFSVSDKDRLAAAADWGHSVSRVPFGVLYPRSVDDVQKMVRFARAKHIPVTMRGRGHSISGQTQALGGITIDSSTLNGVRWVGHDLIDVQPGATWREVVAKTLDRGLTPPVVPDVAYTLTVGGMLSVGGHGETSHLYGGMVDNLVELEVVTGASERVICSPTQNPELFDAVRAGMGQCGIIVRARVRLMPAPESVTTTTVVANSPEEFLATLKAKTQASHSGLAGFFLPRADGTFAGSVVSHDFDVPGAKADEGDAVSYWKYVNRNTEDFREQERSGDVLKPHPNLSFSVPESAALWVMKRILSDPDMLIGTGRIGASYMNIEHYKAPLLQLPNAEHGYQIRVARQAVRPGDPMQMRMLNANMRLMNEILAVGGKIYFPWSPNLNKPQLAAHYGLDKLHAFAELKRKYDPDGILAPNALPGLGG